MRASVSTCLPFSSARSGNRVVHIGPRAYDDGVYIRIVEKLRPLVVDPWDTLLARNELARMAGAVDDAQDLDALNGLETRYVGVPRVGTGPRRNPPLPYVGTYPYLWKRSL